MGDTFTADLDAVAPLAESFLAAGHRLYLVGGAVRDRLLGAPARPGDDVDLTTDARPDEIVTLVADRVDAIWEQGRRFGTIGCRRGDQLFEITTHRSDSYVATSRKPDVAFSDDVVVDLSRRDFTVNAMAVDVDSGELIDPHGGRADLADKVLRTPSGPDISFRDDPLRMLRAGRFIARLGLRPVDGIVAAVERHRDRLAIVSRERVRDELDKLLATERPGDGIAFLDRTGLLEPTVGTALGEPHRLSTVLDRAPLGGTTRLAALVCHAEDPVRALRDLRYGRDDIASVSAAIRGWRRIEAHDGAWDLPAVRALAAATGADLASAIDLARVTSPQRAARLDAVLASTEENLTDPPRPLDGDDIMDLLDLPPGPVVGRALGVLEDHRIAHGPIDRDEALDLLRAWRARTGGA